MDDRYDLVGFFIDKEGGFRSTLMSLLDGSPLSDSAGSISFAAGTFALVNIVFLMLSHVLCLLFLVLQCLVDADADGLVVLLLDIERLHGVIELGAEDCGYALHFGMHVFGASHLTCRVTLFSPGKHSHDHRW